MVMPLTDSLSHPRPESSTTKGVGAQTYPQILKCFACQAVLADIPLLQREFSELCDLGAEFEV